MEILYNAELRADRAMTSAQDHSGMLNPSELRLITEWLDTGATYYNSAFGTDTNNNGVNNLTEVVNRVNTLPFNEFRDNVHPVLMSRCAGCHKPIGNKSDFDSRLITSTLTNTPPSEFVLPRMVLTGDINGDYQVASAFVENRSNAAQNTLLLRAISTGRNPAHPQVIDANGNFIPTLSSSHVDYQAISIWISEP